jgi:hypothetical protein
MITDLFIKTYPKDYDWLIYSLQSVKKRVKGYGTLHIVIPEGTEKEFYSKIKDFPPETNVHAVKEECNGYIWQQYIKMSAFNYSHADQIVFFDSDNIWQIDTDYSQGIEKPLILMTDYSKVGDAICWKQVVDDIFKKDVRYEFMRRLPFVYHRSTLTSFAEWIKCDLKDFIIKRNRFSEFNVIGAYAYYYEPEKYTFLDTDNWTFTKPLLRQFWSLEGLDKNIKEVLSLLE